MLLSLSLVTTISFNIFGSRVPGNFEKNKKKLLMLLLSLEINEHFVTYFIIIYFIFFIFFHFNTLL